jgi:hypothetical protein
MFARKRYQQIARVFFVARTARELLVRQYRGHAVVDPCDKFVSRNGDDRKGALPLVRFGIAPVFPDAGDAEDLAVAARDRVALPVRVLLEKAVPAQALQVQVHFLAV